MTSFQAPRRFPPVALPQSILGLPARVAALESRTTYPSFTVEPQDGVNEGGDIGLQGAGSFASWNIDNFQGTLRFHSGGTAYAQLSPTGFFINSQLVMNGTKVLGPRDTGWTAMTGTSNKNTAYATSTVTLAQLAGRVMSIQAALTTHGLIGA